jgi:hypothetical protein
MLVTPTANAWRYNPVPEHVLQRWSIGAQIERDADAYQELIDELRLGHAGQFPARAFAECHDRASHSR